jgi:hypothetical protein
MFSCEVKILTHFPINIFNNTCPTVFFLPTTAIRVAPLCFYMVPRREKLMEELYTGPAMLLLQYKTM